MPKKNELEADVPMNEEILGRRFLHAGFREPDPAFQRQDLRGPEYGTWKVLYMNNQLFVVKKSSLGKHLYKMQFNTWGDFYEWARDEQRV